MDIYHMYIIINNFDIVIVCVRARARACVCVCENQYT